MGSSHSSSSVALRPDSKGETVRIPSPSPFSSAAAGGGRWGLRWSSLIPPFPRRRALDGREDTTDVSRPSCLSFPTQERKRERREEIPLPFFCLVELKALLRPSVHARLGEQFVPEPKTRRQRVVEDGKKGSVKGK